MMPTTNLHERDRETAAIRQALDAVIGGRGSFLFVRGGAGTGKSALLKEAATYAHDAGLHVVEIRGSHDEYQFQHKAALRAVQTLQDTMAPSARDAFQQALPSVAAALDHRDVRFGAAEGPEMTLVLAAATRLLPRHGVGPLLLVIDNMHWLDRGSLGWLSLLIEDLGSLPVLILGSVCDGLAGTDIEILEDLLVDATLCGQLRPLSGQAAQAVIARALPTEPAPAFVDAAVHVTGGNPLLLATLVELVTDLGILPDASSARVLDELAPDTVAMSIRVRTRRIAPQAFTLYRIVAALGRDATIDTLAYLAGIDAVVVEEICSAMCKMGLLDKEQDQLTVAQPLARNAVLRECPPTFLQNVHEQAARLLQKVGAPDDSVARHLLVVARPLTEPWVVPTLFAAAQQARATGDTGTYTAYLQRLLVEPLPSDVLAGVHTDLSAVLAQVDIAAASAHLALAVASSPHSVGERVTSELFVMLALAERKEQMEAVYRITDAERRLPLAPSMRLLRDLRFGGSPSPDPADHIATPDDNALAIALRVWNDTTRLSGSARSAAKRAFQMATVPVRGAEGVISRAFAVRVLAATGQIRNALHLCEAIVGQVGGQGIAPVTAVALCVRARVRRRQGMLSDARADVVAAQDLIRGWDSAGTSSLWTFLNIEALHASFDLETLDTAWELADRISGGPRGDRSDREITARYWMGRLRMRSGDVPGALQDFIACGRLSEVFGVTNPAVLPWKLHAAVALLRLGRASEARRYVAEHLEMATLWGAPGPIAAGLRVLARLTDPQKSMAVLEEAIDVVQATEEHVGLAYALLERGQQLRATGDYATARKVLREAHDIVLALDSPLLLEGIRLELVAVGGRAPRHRRQGVDGLTESERRVALLAAHGKKNREIAQSLFVHQRTVEIHLTNTYRKLGIGGRDELAAVLIG